MRHRTRIGAAGLLLAVAGCQAPMEAHLIRLGSVAPDRIEAPATVEILGSGFASGRRAQLSLVGTVHRPGAAPLNVDAVATGRAASTRRIRWRVTEQLVDSLGGRGTFHGDLVVRFATPAGDGFVTGRLRDLQLDFAPAVSRRPPDGLVHRRHALAFLRQAGVTPADAQGRPGIGVQSVQAGSPADLSGVLKGDRILTLDGLRLAGVSEFVPPPGQRARSLVLFRPGRATPLHVSLAPSPSRPSTPQDGWAARVLAAFLLLVLAFLAPTARLTARVGDLARDATRAAADSWRVRRGAVHAAVPTRRGDAARLAGAAMSLLAAGTALAALPCTQRFTHGGLDVLDLLLVAFGARMIVAVSWSAPSSASGPSRTRGPFAALGRAAAVLLRPARDASPTWVLVASAALATGSVQMQGALAAQGGAPWQWLVFRSPALFLTFPAVLWSLSSVAPSAGLCAGGSEATASVRRVAAIAARLHLFVVSGLVTALVLGGWKLPGEVADPFWGPPALRVAAVGLFVLKALGLCLAVTLLRRRAPWQRRGRRGSLCLAAAGLAVSPATLTYLPAGTPVAEVSGVVLFGLCVLVSAYALGRAAGRGRRVLHLPSFL